MAPSQVVEAPQKQQPMEVVNPSVVGGEKNAVVTSQPTSQPRPSPDGDQPQMSLRGGGLSCGFDCCNGSCRFYKTCC